jgi:hypothetical protein
MGTRKMVLSGWLELEYLEELYPFCKLMESKIPQSSL